MNYGNNSVGCSSASYLCRPETPTEFISILMVRNRDDHFSTCTMINSLSVEKLYAQTASTVSILRSILDGYPLSARILWEILANSDDAGASKQVWIIISISDKFAHSV